MRDHVVVESTEISPREADVLAALGEQLSNAQIARRLHISVRTVESHVSSLLRKLGVTDRRALAGLAGPLAEPSVPIGRLAGIPTSRTTFVGRSRDQNVALERLAGARLVTLLGPGGVGKTRLAAVVAESAAPSYPAGGAFVDLVPVRTGFVVPTVASALGVTERPPRTLEDAVVERLVVGRSLVVLDNCEHLLEEIGRFVDRVLSECPEAAILATSRQRLGLTGEHVAPVRRLPLDSDAQRLFIDRALAVSPDFAADPSVVTRICARLDGMPLAIELAAARSASLGAEGLLAALDEQLRLLTGGRQADERHRSLRAVIGWSYDLLDADEQALFRRLSVFVGGFDLTAAQAISPGATRGEVADLVGWLVDKSLLVHGTESGRWRLLDTIRAYGRERLAEAGEAEVIRRRHLEWAAETSAALEARISEEWTADFDAVADDFRAALDGTEPVPDTTSHGLARSLAHLTFARRFFVEARAHYRAAADRTDDAAAAGRDLLDAAAAAVIVSDGSDTFSLLMEAAERARAADDDNARAAALAHAVIVTVRYPAGLRGAVTPERRAELLREATEAADADPTTDALLAAARAWDARGGPAELALSRTAVEAARRSEDPELIAGALDALGFAAIAAGRFREAHRIADERIGVVAALAAHEPAGAAEITDAYHVVSSSAMAAGDLPSAWTAVQRARRHDPIGEHPYLSAPKVVRVLALSGRFDEATEAAQTLWDNWVRDGEPPMAWMSSALAAASLVHGLRADGDDELWLSRALTVAGNDAPTRSADLMAIVAFVEARTAIHSGDYERAVDLVERADAVFPERWWEGYARAAGVELAVVAGLPDAAERLARIEPLAGEHEWAAACLARARGRLERDPDAIARALARWERLESRFERACTLLLLPDRESEGRAELEALGCKPPA